jgi:hypothetical protein
VGPSNEEVIAAVEATGGQALHRGEHVPDVPYLDPVDPDSYVIEL